MLARDPRAWTIFGLALCSLGLPLVLLHGYDLATQFEDDAFYYFQFARQLVRAEELASNGFHPLWLGVLVPVFGALRSFEGAVRAVGLLEAALVGAAGVMTYAALQARVGRTRALLAGMLIFALPGTRSVLRSGLESALTLCLFAAIVCARERAGPRRDAWLAGLCALLSLARLEAACVVLIVAWLDRRRGRALLRLVAPTLGVLLAYVLWNQHQFGAALPVSGMVKVFWANGSDRTWLRALAWLLPALAAVSGKWLPAHARLPVLSAAIMLGCDLALLGQIERWYLGPALLGAAALAAGLVPAPSFAIAALALCALSRVPLTLYSVHHESYQARVRGEAADWLRAHTRANARAGAWSSGMLGYYSERTVVNLDGLANTPGFFHRAIERDDLLGYLREQHIASLLTMTCELPPQLRAAYSLQGPASDRPEARACQDAFGVWVTR